MIRSAATVTAQSTPALGVGIERPSDSRHGVEFSGKPLRPFLEQPSGDLLDPEANSIELERFSR